MKKTTLQDYFSIIVDERKETKNKLHKLLDIIVITVCGVISGANDWVSVEMFGNAQKDWLTKFLELPNGIPSHDTFTRVFRFIDPEQFRKCFVAWMENVVELKKNEVVAIDGKTIRRSYDKRNGKGAIHIISALATEKGLVCGQIKTEEKSNEITAIPKLLETLFLNGCIVTIDAMGCQKEIAQKICEKGADYVFALKGNHKNLYEDVKVFLDDALNSDFRDIRFDSYKTINKDHGRIEKRNYYITDNIEWLNSKEDWKNLKTVGLAISEIKIGDKKTIEARYYISSIDLDAKKFGDAVRKHWLIESFHWTLDVTFREDYSRARKDYEAENMAVARHIAMNILKQDKSKLSIEKKRYKCALDSKYLNKVVFGD
jgi:predicted transposase YbfD/YdcC